jgi:hypothetical protein
MKKIPQSENKMVKIIDCPLCNGGKLKIDIANGYKVITDGFVSKLPLKKRCSICNRNVKYIVVRDEDYENTLKWVQQK